MADDYANLVDFRSGPPRAERGVLSRLLVKLAGYFKGADCDHLFGYSDL